LSNFDDSLIPVDDSLVPVDFIPPEDELEIRIAKQHQHIQSAEYLQECFFYHKGGFLIWRKRPRNHFRSYSVSERWNKDHAEKNACKQDFPKATITIDGCVYNAATIIYLYHVAIRSPKNFSLVKFSGKTIIKFPYAEENGSLLYTPHIRHSNKILCDNRIENLHPHTIKHNPVTLPRDVHFKLHHEEDYDRWAITALKHNKPITIAAYETTEKAALRTLWDLKRIFK
jgi:hypothetical protein